MIEQEAALGRKFHYASLPPVSMFVKCNLKVSDV